jgi:general secretion pathway protein A
VAGHRGALPFDRKALQAIHRLTRGVPRRINLLCGRALLGAWATGQQSVNPSIVKKAAGEVFGQLPTAAKQTSGITRTVWLLAILGILLGLLAATHLNLSAGLTTPKQAPQLATTQDVSKSQAQAAVTPASTTATASTTITSTTVTSTTTSSTALPLEAVLPQLASDINLAWNALAPLWQLPANSADLCATASAEQLQCYRTTKLNLPLLRQLARPGIVVLQANENTRSPAAATATVYAVLLDLGENTAILQIGDQRQTVSLSTLLLRWRGEFATLWRAPEGYSRAAEVGAKSPAISLLRQQLQQLDGLPASSPSANPANAQLLDAALKQRLRDFQRTHGLTADGLPGPMTYMQLESALRINTPRLPGTVL